MPATGKVANKPTTSHSRKATDKPKVRKRKKKVRKVSLGVWTAVGIALAVILGLLLVFHRWNGGQGYETGARIPSGEWRFGIDVSHHNEGWIVWDSLYVMTDSRGRTVRDPYKAKKITRVSFAYIKATEGISMVDGDFKGNWKKAGRAGLRRGAYHFFRSSKDGNGQADLFIRTVGKLRFKDLPPVLDIETIHKGCSRKKLNEEALEWLRTIEKHYGRKPVVYTGATFAKDYLSKEILDNYPVWVAHYHKERPDFDGWLLWQFTDRAVVKGVPGTVDLNVMQKSDADGK